VTIAGKAVDWKAIDVGSCLNWSITIDLFGTSPDGRKLSTASLAIASAQ
jgi:hypothetical protein